MNYLDILNKICSDYSGINLQTILIDPLRPDDEPETVFSYDEIAQVFFSSTPSGISVSITLDDEEEFNDIFDALETMEGFETPDSKILSNILTLIPKDISDEDTFVYAAGYISTATTRTENLTITFTFLYDDFQVYEEVL